jgi:ACS family tartrate transporter-like MFS transporter
MIRQVFINIRQMLGSAAALDRARGKAYLRLLPLLFLCYVIAYVDRVNVGFAKLNMKSDLAPLGFSEGVFGFGMGVFFIGYLLLEIPGTLIVEHWSARKWISRIMISWGFIAALTAFVHLRSPIITPMIEALGRVLAVLIRGLGALPLPSLRDWASTTATLFESANGTYVLQFYTVRFLLGLAEAGFFPGVIVYLTHWFPRKDRTKALSLFFIGTPIAQIIGPPISALLMGIGRGGRPPFLGLVGWQWVFIAWGIPAVVLGAIVLAFLPDRPKDAKWLSGEERDALDAELAREKAEHKAASGHMSIVQGLTNPKVLLLAAAYFFVVTGNYGVELYMASILSDWYKLVVENVAYLIIIPPIGSLIGQIFVGWNSDRTQERRWHASIPIVIGAAALSLTPRLRLPTPVVTVLLFTVAMTGLKAYLPAFWALPTLLMTESAAAASIGLINSFGNLGGWIGPSVVGAVKGHYDNLADAASPAAREAIRNSGYNYGIWFLAASMIVSACIILNLGIGRTSIKAAGASGPHDPDTSPSPAGERDQATSSQG